jgi:hypothetical protein
MTIDGAILRAAESAREDQQPFYVYHAGTQHFVSPHAGLGGVWDAVAHPDGRIALRHIFAAPTAS